MKCHVSQCIGMVLWIIFYFDRPFLHINAMNNIIRWLVILECCYFSLLLAFHSWNLMFYFSFLSNWHKTGIKEKINKKEMQSNLSKIMHHFSFINTTFGIHELYMNQQALSSYNQTSLLQVKQPQHYDSNRVAPATYLFLLEFPLFPYIPNQSSPYNSPSLTVNTIYCNI